MVGLDGVGLHHGLVVADHFAVLLHQGPSHVVEQLLSASFWGDDVPGFEQSFLPVEAAQGCGRLCRSFP